MSSRPTPAPRRPAIRTHALVLVLAVVLAVAASGVIATPALASDPALTPVGTAPEGVAAAKPPVMPPQAAGAPSAAARQGGDTVLDAAPLTLPVIGQTGTTAGYTDDYDEVCPYSGSTSPDVVYTFIPVESMSVDIDMLGSTYDTKIYVYSEQLQLVACNDDFYPDYVSKIENLPLVAGVRYYLVIDGYGGDFGDYLLTITEHEICDIEYISWAEDEQEPALTDGYVDEHNGGCNTPGLEPFQSISGWIFMGRSGWFLGPDGQNSRDTDWFELMIDYSGFIEVIGDAEQPCYMFELGPQDCGSVGVIQSVPIGPCSEGTMVIPGPVGSTVWFWVGPQEFEPPDGFVGHEFYYVLYLNLIVPTEDVTFSEVKALFR